jgi:hypothetical protein
MLMDRARKKASSMVLIGLRAEMWGTRALFHAIRRMKVAMRTLRTKHEKLGEHIGLVFRLDDFLEHLLEVNIFFSR